MTDVLRQSFTERFAATRNLTTQIFDLTEEATLHKSPGFGFRPIMWHLAHLGAYEEFWLLMQTKGDAPINERFQIIFDPIKTPRENSKDLPSKLEMRDYLKSVRENVQNLIEKADFNGDNEFLRDGYIFDLVHQHELQHQETLAYLFHLLPVEKLQAPQLESEAENQNAKPDSSQISFESTFCEIGANSNSFAYDNEKPSHAKFVQCFKLDKFLTTNAQFADFINEKGYERREFWSEQGWNFKQKEEWNTPLYWSKTGEKDWKIRTMFAEKDLQSVADFPVYGVSFYEAEAFAKFRGKRLPTEFEWERATSFNHENEGEPDIEPTPETSNFGFNFWNTTPVNRFVSDISGCADLRGNVWEWTTSNFAAYPDFTPFPYPEYSQEWFDGDHKVLKGGSWATHKPITRSSFRNFFRRHFRIAFAGIRCAENI